jgi:hypothetical protein
VSAGVVPDDRLGRRDNSWPVRAGVRDTRGTSGAVLHRRMTSSGRLSLRVGVPNRSSICSELAIVVDQSANPGHGIAGQRRVVMRPGSPVVVDELSRRLVPTE